MDDVTHAVREAVHCLDRRACVVLLDSVLDKGLLRPHELTALLNETARGRQLARLVDVSESGTETLARLALRRLRLPVRTQVPVRGVGRVDLVIGDRLVLEVDGEEWHDRASTFEQDRSRDRALTVMGFIVMRASYKQVMHEWALVEEQVLAIVRRNEHRWTSRGRRSPRI